MDEEDQASTKGMKVDISTDEEKHDSNNTEGGNDEKEIYLIE